METKYPTLKDKPLEFFLKKKTPQTQRTEAIIEVHHFIKCVESMLSAWKASFLVANYIFKTRKSLYYW